MTEIKSNLKTAICVEAEKCFINNRMKNVHSAGERQAQKELDILMAQALDGEYGKIEHTFRHNTGQPGGNVTLEILYQQDIRDVIDIKKLYGKVDMETFLSIVTASNAAVVREAGKNIAAQCMGSKVGDFKVKVKEKR